MSPFTGGVASGNGTFDKDAGKAYEMPLRRAQCRAGRVKGVIVEEVKTAETAA